MVAGLRTAGDTLNPWMSEAVAWWLLDAGDRRSGKRRLLSRPGAEIGRLPLTVPIDDVLGLDSQHNFEDDRTSEILGRYVEIWIEEYGFADDDESDEWEDTFSALHDSFLEHLQEDWRPDLLPPLSRQPNSVISPLNSRLCSSASPTDSPTSLTPSRTKTSSPWPPGVSSKRSRDNASLNAPASCAGSHGSAPAQEAPTACAQHPAEPQAAGR